MILLIKIILAHLIGDFLLQPYKWVVVKEKKKLGAWQLYVHCLIHGVVTMLIVWDWNFLPAAAIITGIHLLIDATKLLTQTEKNKPVYFFVDQVVHFVVLYFVWLWYQGLPIQLDFLLTEQSLLLITFLFLLTYPSSISILVCMAGWAQKTGDVRSESLRSAGQYIGMLERMVIFVFITTNHWEAIGILILAKSVYHIGEIKASKDGKHTEYILLGTLLSYGFAIAISIVYLQFAV